MEISQDDKGFLTTKNDGKEAFNGQSLRDSLPDYEHLDTSNVSPIDVLLSQEPDLSKNMYVAYILLRKSGEGPTATNYTTLSNNWNTNATEYIETNFTNPRSNDYSMFALRLNGFKLPQKQAQTSTYKFLGRDVPMLTSKFSSNNKGSITLRLDQCLYTLDNMNILSGDWSTMTEVTKPSFWTAKDKMYTTNFFPMLYSSNSSKYTFNAISEVVKGSKPRVDLIVDTMANTAFEESIDGYSQKRYRYVLSDVRFLGRSSGLQFQDSANAQEATYDYIFKRQYKIQLAAEKVESNSLNLNITTPANLSILTPNSLPTLA